MLQKTIDFLRGIGIPCEIVPGAKGFLNGVRIVDGGLHIDPGAHLSNVLHEAGHLAIMPARFRHLANDDISRVLRHMMSAVDFSNPDAPEARAVLQCSDVEATAWAWAAGEAIGLAPEVIIRDDEYEGEGADVRQMLQMRAYAGIHGLACAGFCVTRPGRLEEVCRRPSFPRLAMWLQH